MDNRLKYAILLLVLPVPFVVNETVAATFHYRDPFFYADALVANGILEGGRIPRGNLADPSYYWRKVSARQLRPILPIFMALGTKITGLPLYIFHSRLPLTVGIGVIYFLIAREFSSTRIAFAIAFTGTVGPNLSPFTTGGRAIKYVVLLMIVLILVWRANRRRGSVKLAAVVVPLLLVHLLFSYGRLFIYASIIVIVASFLFYILFGDRLLAGMITGAVGIWAMITIPFPAYLGAFISVLLGSLSLLPMVGEGVELSVGSLLGQGPEASDLNQHKLPTVPYNYIEFLLIFPASIGALKNLRKVWTVLQNRAHSAHVVLFAWGLAIGMFALAHLLSGRIWLIYRIFPFASPLMLVATAIAIDDLPGRPAWKNVTAAVIAVAILISYILSAGGGGIAVMTYSHEDAAGGEWTGEFSDGMVVSDMSHAAIVATAGGEARYPSNNTEMEQFFYQDPPLNVTDADLVLLSDSFRDTGLYIPPWPREPVSEQWYKETTKKNNLIYANGDNQVVSTDG